MKCETCAHWCASDRLTAYAGECAMASYPGRVTFDMTCDKHSQKAPPTPPQDQSNVRSAPAIVQMWQGRP